jgi:hypothetical protein
MGTQQIRANQINIDADLPFNSHKATGVTDPTAAQDAATKAYVDAHGGIPWSIITADQAAAVGNGYVCNKGTLLTLTLPAVAAVGSVIRVAGMNAGLWKIAQNASGQIHFGNQDTTSGVGGYLASVLARDAVELVCVVANNEWNVVGSIGNITVA